MLIDGIAALAQARPPVIVAGAGPVGLALATELARQGVNVLLLESGGANADPEVQALSDAELIEPARHDEMSVAVARRLGGSSNLWGGRCVPYDPVDFASRDHVAARWPIGYAALTPYWQRAVAAMRCGAAVFKADETLAPQAGAEFTADTLERWVNVQAAQAVHREAILAEPRLEVRSHATLVNLDFAEDGRVTTVEVAHTRSGERVRIPVRMLVLAAGGVETTRLLLASRRPRPGLFGGEAGPLGRYYMGHVIGEIADIVFAGPDTARAFDYHVDTHGSYARRRIVATAQTQIRHRLLNAAFWPVVPPVADARHGSAILSLVYLALKCGPLGRMIVAEAIRRRHIVPQRHGGSLFRHLANIATGLPSALAFSASFLRRRHDRSVRLPGFFVLNSANRYGLSFHAEHAPNPASRVWLAGGADRLGLPSLAIDLRFSSQDVDSLVATHGLLADWLGTSGLGRLEYRMPIERRGEAVMALAAHGTHQIGLTRMAASARDGVVDSDLRTFDSPNLHIASCSVLPTSGQANPTFTAVALALRLADHLTRELARLPITPGSLAR